MARTVLIEATGGPEVIQWVDVELADPGPGEVRMRHSAVGLNFIDVYHRSGVYPVTLPSGLGTEAVGVVEALGEGVSGFAVGDRVGTFGPALGAYATARNVSAASLLPLPDDVDDATAAALLLKGCTTEFLVERCAHVQAGQTVLVHAAAGGVGHLLVGWLKAIGATVIGTVGSAEKAAQAKAAGADHVIFHKTENVAVRVREMTGGAGVPVVFDGIGLATWDISLASAAPRGLIVSYGNAGGRVTGVDIGVLATRGSLFVTRPTLFHYYATPEERRDGTARLFEMLRQGAIVPEIGQTFALQDVAEAHRALEAGATRGATVLMV
ncbi:quinone oxidoreductase [Sphingomonas sp.]|uniref:quinone oxidoreductase family protein n=1 Tax=Sphingomonas sp. TaxID=28214 RepID=UPI003341D610